MNNFYVFVCSNDSEADSFNSYHDFTISLPNSIDFISNDWEVGLVDLTLNSQMNKEKLIICSNLISSSYICSSLDQILRFLPKISNENYSYIEFKNIIYHGVLVRNLNFLRIYIKSWNGDSLTFGTGSLNCTLHFRRKKD